MRLQARMRSEPTIPTASMADIAFLLIIFFMLTITFEVDKTQVVLPKTELRFEVPKKAAYVSVDSNGQLRVSDGEEMSAVVPGVDDVLSFAAGVVAIDPTKAFVVKAGGDTQYQHVDKIIDALKRAKVELIYLLSDQETIEAVGGQP